MENIKTYSWINESELKVEDDRFFIKAMPESDFFRSPVDDTVVESAQFLYKEIEGDFLIRVRVKPIFEHIYDACSIFIYADETRWLKTAFEFTDLGPNAIVTVATDGYSDDANGVEIKEDSVYLQVIRKGNAFACHYSTDGVNFKMARLLRIESPSTVKVGVSAQSPTGTGGFMEFSDLMITDKLPEDIRSLEG